MRRTKITSITGKTIAAKRPARRATCSASIPVLSKSHWDSAAASETNPVSHGPAEQPMSPPMAISANRAVPALGSASAAITSVPGHIRLTDNPQTPHASRESIGHGEKTTVR